MIRISALIGVAAGFAILAGCAMLGQPDQSLVISVESPTKEFLDGYLNWIHEHQKGDFDVKLPDPYIDLYDSSGRSIHFEDHPDRASAFLRLLLDAATSPIDSHPVQRPSLAEAMAMFSALRQHAGQSGKFRYTVFALTNLDKAAVCKQQDEAVAELKKRASDLNIRVVEVRIHRS